MRPTIARKQYLIGGAGLVLALGFALASSTLGPQSSDSQPKTRASKSKSGGFSFQLGGKRSRVVEILAPRRGSIATTIQAPGTLRAGSEVGIGAAFAGKVLRLHKDEGDWVEADELVFELDPKEHQQKVREAEIDMARKEAFLAEAQLEKGEAERKRKESKEEPSELTEAQLKARQAELQEQRSGAQLQAARSKLNRSQLMLKQGIGSKIEVEAAQSELEVAAYSQRIAEKDLTLARETVAFRTQTWKQAQGEAEKNLTVAGSKQLRARADRQGAELALERARRDLADCQIRSPIRGLITGRGVNKGDLVVRASGDVTPHYIISDLSRLVVYADVDEGDVIKIAKGQAAQVSMSALADTSLEGRVYDVGFRAQQEAGQEVPTFRVRVLLSPKQDKLSQLRPGMTCSAEIETARVEKALKLPIQAVLQREREELPEDLATLIPAELRNQLKEKKLKGKKDDLLDVVFVLSGGKAQLRLVELGLQDDDEVEITGGLEEKAQVVVGPFRTLDKLEQGDSLRGEAPEMVPAEEEAPEDQAASAGSAEQPAPDPGKERGSGR